MMETSTDDGVSSLGSTKTRLSNNERKSVEKWKMKLAALTESHLDVGSFPTFSSSALKLDDSGYYAATCVVGPKF